MTKGPQPITVERAHAYLEWHMQMGAGKDILALDRRGLEHLLEGHLPTKGLGLPQEGDERGGGRVYFRLIY